MIPQTNMSIPSESSCKYKTGNTKKAKYINHIYLHASTHRPISFSFRAFKSIKRILLKETKYMNQLSRIWCLKGFKYNTGITKQAKSTNPLVLVLVYISIYLNKWREPTAPYLGLQGSKYYTGIAECIEDGFIGSSSSHCQPSMFQSDSYICYFFLINRVHAIIDQ